MSTGVCHDRSPVSGIRCCTGDEGEPLGLGVQAQGPNPLKLQTLRAAVVNVEEKAGQGSCQVWVKETSGSEPLRTCRKHLGDVKTGGISLPREQCGGSLWLSASPCSGDAARVGLARAVRVERLTYGSVGDWRCNSSGRPGVVSLRRENRKWAAPIRARVPRRSTGAEEFVVGRKVL